MAAIPAKDGDRQSQEFDVKHYVVSSKKNTQIAEMWDDLLRMMMENQEKAVASNAQKSEDDATNVDNIEQTGEKKQ